MANPTKKENICGNMLTERKNDYVEREREREREREDNGQLRERGNETLVFFCT